VEQQIAFGCYFGLKDLDKYAGDRATVPSISFQYVKNDNGGEDMIPDDSAFFVDNSPAYEGFEMIVASIFEILFILDSQKAGNTVPQEPADVAKHDANLLLFHEAGENYEANVRRRALSRASPDQIQAAREATNASGAASASGAKRTESGPKPKRARERSTASSFTVAGVAAATLPRVPQSSSVVMNIRDNGVGDVCA
jgi:hypothetical protein